MKRKSFFSLLITALSRLKVESRPVRSKRRSRSAFAVGQSVAPRKSIPDSQTGLRRKIPLDFKINVR